MSVSARRRSTTIRTLGLPSPAQPCLSPWTSYAAAIEFYKRAEAIVPKHDVAVALGDLDTLQGQTEEAATQYALVDFIRKLSKANGVIGDLQMAQFLADHDRDLEEALRLAEAEYKTRPTVYGADTLAWCYYKSGKNRRSPKIQRGGIQPADSGSHVPLSSRHDPG